MPALVVTAVSLWTCPAVCFRDGRFAQARLRRHCLCCLSVLSRLVIYHRWAFVTRARSRHDHNEKAPDKGLYCCVCWWCCCCFLLLLLSNNGGPGWLDYRTVHHFPHASLSGSYVSCCCSLHLLRCTPLPPLADHYITILPTSRFFPPCRHTASLELCDSVRGQFVTYCYMTVLSSFRMPVVVAVFVVVLVV